MANPYFDPGRDRATKVEALFTRIASRYDLLNDFQSFGLHRLWKRRLVELACPMPGLRALDLCCGTGDLAFALARRGAQVVGLDFNAKMLEMAEARRSKSSNPTPINRERASKSVSEDCQETKSVCEKMASSPPPSQSLRRAGRPSPPPPSSDFGATSEEERGRIFQTRSKVGERESEQSNPLFVRGDAQRIPFSDKTFDIVTMGYGLRNLADWEIGLREMARVAKSGGKLLALDFGKPDNVLWRTIYFAYLKVCVPLLGLLCCGSASAYAYILESLAHYPAQHGVASKMRELGLSDVGIVNLLGGAMTINYGQKPAR